MSPRFFIWDSERWKFDWKVFVAVKTISKSNEMLIFFCRCQKFRLKNVKTYFSHLSHLQSSFECLELNPLILCSLIGSLQWLYWSRLKVWLTWIRDTAVFKEMKTFDLGDVLPPDTFGITITFLKYFTLITTLWRALAYDLKTLVS